MNPVAPVVVGDLTKRFRSVVAVDSISFTCERGVIGLLGPNGAGKTTVIGAACGLVKKTSGTIRVFGVDLDREPLRPVELCSRPWSSRSPSTARAPGDSRARRTRSKAGASRKSPRRPE